jgi:phosphatidylglycerophosphate synthase
VSATLVVVPAEGPDRVPLETVLLGLTLRQRITLTAQRAGFERVVFLDEKHPGTTDVPGGRVVVIPGAVLPSKKWLMELLQRSAGGPAPASMGPALILDAAQLPSFLSKQTRGVISQPPGNEAPSSTGFFVLQSRFDLPRAEKWLLQGLIRDTEGFMSRHLDRRISLAVSRRLAGTNVTPNQMTLVSVGVGLVGSLFFLRTDPLFETIGALLFLLHSILDGCDGELARLKFMESRRGGVLDFWGDNVIHSAVFACMAIGWRGAVHETWPLALGAAAVVGTILSAGFVFITTMRGPDDGPLFRSVVASQDSRLSRIADALGRRDFIYLVVLFSLFGKASWFLVLSAIGAPAFFVVLVVVAFAPGRGAAPAGGPERNDS